MSGFNLLDKLICVKKKKKKAPVFPDVSKHPLNLELKDIFAIQFISS